MHTRFFAIFGIIMVAVAAAFAVGMRTSAQPAISFIGMGTGTLATDLRTIRFQTTFDVSEQQLLGVVGFSSITDGTAVQATWFSPDERSMPLGRTTIQTESGASVARFSFASKDPWKKAPYLLRIDVETKKGAIYTASGSIPFYIGMSEEEIGAYRKEFQEWQA